MTIRFQNSDRSNGYAWVEARLSYRFAVCHDRTVQLLYSFENGSHTFSPTYFYEGVERQVPQRFQQMTPETIWFYGLVQFGGVDVRMVGGKSIASVGLGCLTAYEADVMKVAEVGEANTPGSQWIERFDLLVEQNGPFVNTYLEDLFASMERTKRDADERAAREKRDSEARAKEQADAAARPQAESRTDRRAPSGSDEPSGSSGDPASREPAPGARSRQAEAERTARALAAREADERERRAQEARDRRTGETMVAVGTAAAPIVAAGLDAIDRGLTEANDGVKRFSQNVFSYQLSTNFLSAASGGSFLHRGGGIFVGCAGVYLRQSESHTLSAPVTKSLYGLPEGTAWIENRRAFEAGLQVGPALAIPFEPLRRSNWYLTLEALGSIGLSVGERMQNVLLSDQAHFQAGLQLGATLSRRLDDDFEVGFGARFGWHTQPDTIELGSLVFTEGGGNWLVSVVVELGWRHITELSKWDKLRGTDE